jgi:hypothetical protein
MAIDMNAINATVKASLDQAGLDYTIDNRVECLAALAKHVAASEELDPADRVCIPLEIATEIVRLRVEKQMFGL